MNQTDPVFGQYQAILRGGRKAYVAANPHLFLVRRAPTFTTKSDWDDDISFATRVHDDINLDDEADDVEHEGWIVVPVKKRDDGPFPDRIGVGRARNCDVVLRFPSVSKLHAQFRVGGSLQLVDVGSVNGTSVNGQAVAPRVPQNVKAGDALRFGSVYVELLDAGTLFDLIDALTTAGV